MLTLGELVSQGQDFQKSNRASVDGPFSSGYRSWFMSAWTGFNQLSTLVFLLFMFFFFFRDVVLTSVLVHLQYLKLFQFIIKLLHRSFYRK